MEVREESADGEVVAGGEGVAGVCAGLISGQTAAKVSCQFREQGWKGGGVPSSSLGEGLGTALGRSVSLAEKMTESKEMPDFLGSSRSCTGFLSCEQLKSSTTRRPDESAWSCDDRSESQRGVGLMALDVA